MDGLQLTHNLSSCATVFRMSSRLLPICLTHSSYYWEKYRDLIWFIWARLVGIQRHTYTRHTPHTPLPCGLSQHMVINLMVTPLAMIGHEFHHGWREKVKCSLCHFYIINTCESCILWTIIITEFFQFIFKKLYNN